MAPTEQPEPEPSGAGNVPGDDTPTDHDMYMAQLGVAEIPFSVMSREQLDNLGRCVWQFSSPGCRTTWFDMPATTSAAVEGV